MGICMQTNTSDGVRLTSLQVQNRGVNHRNKGLRHVICERAQAGSKARRQNQNVQGIVIHGEFFHYMYKDRKRRSKKI